MRRAAIVRPLVTFAATVVLAAGGVTVTARSSSAATSILPDGSIRYDYGRRPSPLLTCKPKYVCDIILESGETVLNLAIGDATPWVIAVGKSGPGGTTPHIFVKPTRLGLETNLVITTTNRVYDVTLRSSDSAPHPQISFFYADDAAAAKAAIAEHEQAAIEAVLAGNPLVGADRADANYKVTGDADLLPDKVFNDGVRTFVKWKTLPNELPSVVAIAKGSSTPENFRVVGNSYIIDSVVPSFDLVLAENDRHARSERRVLVRHQ